MAAAKPAMAKQRPWTEVGDEALGEELTFNAETSETCCGDARFEYDGSPARLYIATVDCKGKGCADAINHDGWIAYLGKGDIAVLAHQTGAGVYGEELWRSAESVQRTSTGVTLSVPGKLLPGGTLRVWAATRVPTKIGKTAIPVFLDDGSIPYLRVETGRPAPVQEPWGVTEDEAVPAPPGRPAEAGVDVGEEPWGVLPDGVEAPRGEPAADKTDVTPSTEPAGGD